MEGPKVHIGEIKDTLVRLFLEVEEEQVRAPEHDVETRAAARGPGKAPRAGFSDQNTLKYTENM